MNPAVVLLLGCRCVALFSVRFAIQQKNRPITINDNRKIKKQIRLNLMKNLKERIRAGEALHGCWINLGSPVSAEIIGRAGFDWVLIDLEHGAGNDGVMYQQLQVLESAQATALVRTDDLSRPKAQRILDAGANGIMFPRIETAEEALLAASMLYYPPKGVRGMAKMTRASAFGKSIQDYIANQENNLVGIIQIETISALKQIDAIASLDGVDILFVGPSDLSLALGIFGQLNHADYQAAIRNVAQAAKKAGKAVGVLLQDVSEYEMYHQLGFRFLACGADSSFVARGADTMVKAMKEKIK
jgi:4-hydroxy-2-oxoheptanedioate aldolase